MAGVSTEAGSSFEGGSSGQNQLQCQSGEASNEWRSLEQVENGTPSTSPPYWDIENDEDGGQKPSELYGKHTWKIDSFSQINKRELRSNVFEVGGYKWYILIYPQGCDVCNHLSLFLCVANHDKLLPGWSHFAQFTIAVVNKDAKKSKYSDTLHRFWKKEHDWGWKKFMELGKVMDGFIDDDSLVIKAQVQVIRERADRPFRCLDCQYRRELVRVYLTNVEQICRRFVEDRRMRLGKLIEDKARWSSFCGFWLGMEQSNRRRMSRERTESILKVVVKNFFIEKEVTSTLVMDSLYSGLKALEGQTKGKKMKGKYADADELPTPIILIEEDTFVLMDDVLILLERAAMEPLPPKEDKGPQNRTKDAAAGEEFNKDSVERDEKRLTELGRRTIEIFVLSHIFSKIEVAYQEAVALKRQEELIREEEAAAAWVTEIDHKPRRGGAAASDKKSKKKQGKQKKNNRKGKDKSREEKLNIIAQDKHELDAPSIEIKDLADESVEKSEAMEDVSDVEALPLDSEERDVSPVNWDTDTSEPRPPTEASSSGISVLSGLHNSPSVVDDSSSTCSSDSVPSAVLNVPHMGNYRNQKNQNVATRGTKNQGKAVYDNWVREEASQASEAAVGASVAIDVDATQSFKTVENPTQAVVDSFKDRVNGNDRRVDKEERTRSTNRNSAAKDVATEPSARGTPSAASPPQSPSKNVPSINPPKPESKFNIVTDPAAILKKSLSTGPKQDRSMSISTSPENTTASKPDNTRKLPTPKPTGTHPVSEKTSMPPMPVMSRPLSAPLVPARRPPVSVVQTSPALSRSASAAGRLGPEPSVSASSPSYVVQSYRNAIIGSNNVTATSSAYAPNHSRANASNPYSPTSRPLRMDANPVQPMFSFGMPGRHEPLQNGPRWMDVSQNDHATLINDMHNLNMYNHVAYTRPHDHFPSEFPPVATSACQNHPAVTDEFPHLDIINDLLDDEYVYGNAVAGSGSGYPGFNSGPNGLSRQFSFPGDLGLSNGLGPCRFERTRTYQDDGFQQSYGASGSPYEMIPQVSPSPYQNGPMEGLMPNQWQIPGSDLPYQGVMNPDSDPYPYHHLPDYPNLSVGANGYSVFRPSNGH